MDTIFVVHLSSRTVLGVCSTFFLVSPFFLIHMMPFLQSLSSAIFIPNGSIAKYRLFLFNWSLLKHSYQNNTWKHFLLKGSLNICPLLLSKYFHLITSIETEALTNQNATACFYIDQTILHIYINIIFIASSHLFKFPHCIYYEVKILSLLCPTSPVARGCKFKVQILRCSSK